MAMEWGRCPAVAARRLVLVAAICAFTGRSLVGASVGPWISHCKSFMLFIVTNSFYLLERRSESESLTLNAAHVKCMSKLRVRLNKKTSSDNISIETSETTVKLILLAEMQIPIFRGLLCFAMSSCFLRRPLPILYANSCDKFMS